MILKDLVVAYVLKTESLNMKRPGYWIIISSNIFVRPGWCIFEIAKKFWVKKTENARLN